MTYEEAIARLIKHQLCDNTGFSNEYDVEATDKAIEALEKQIPIKVIKLRTSGGQEGIMCPTCQRMTNSRDLNGMIRYCPYCGQKISIPFGLEDLELEKDYET